MILVIDDDKAVCASLRMLLSRNGYEVQTLNSPAQALEAFRNSSPELILMDMNFSEATTGEEGLHLLRQAKIFLPDTPVILITGWGSISLAVEGMKRGAFDFITKPWDTALLLQRINTALSLCASSRRTEHLHEDFSRELIIGENPELLKVLGILERVAPTDASVLILGENGTGKELIAEAIHRNSPRRKEPFVKVNLGGMPPSLFESEMFGHAKGAFTGAVAARKGRFEMADRGTIFLDEIGDLDAGSQVKLLRVLQEHTFEPLGMSRTRHVDIRVICATNANLTKMVAERSFREDLFYRINLITLRLPPLRERRDDIPALARFFSRKAAREAGLPDVPDLSSDALSFLRDLNYPGNIRQLANMVNRAIIVSGGGTLHRRHFESDPTLSGLDTSRPGELSSATSPAGGGAGENISAPGSTSRTLSEIEKDAITLALRKFDGNLSRAAAALGISRQALYRKMEKFNLSPSDNNQ